MDRRIRVTTRKDRSMHGIQYGVANLPKTSSDSAREACIAKDLAFHASLRLGSLSGDLSRRSIAVRWAAGLLGG